jgi:hypothetical protein
MKIGDSGNSQYPISTEGQGVPSVDEANTHIAFWPHCSVYKLDIQEAASEAIPASWFSVLDYRIFRTVLDLLIEYHSTGCPEIQVLKDIESGKLFLAGGKIDHPTLSETPQGSYLTLAKSNQAHLSIDLSTLGKMEELHIYKKMAPTYFKGETLPHAPIKVLDASDELLLAFKMIG